MDEVELARRSATALRLKAARFLAGEPRWDAEKGKYKVHAISAAVLAEREPLKSNQISADILGAIERMERPTFPMELEKIAQGLRLDTQYFATEPLSGDAPPAVQLNGVEFLSLLDADRDGAIRRLQERMKKQREEDEPETPSGGAT